MTARRHCSEVSLGDDTRFWNDIVAEVAQSRDCMKTTESYTLKGQVLQYMKYIATEVKYRL